MNISILIVFLLLGFFGAENLVGRVTHKRGLLHTVALGEHGYVLYVKLWLAALVLGILFLISGWHWGVIYAFLIGAMVQGFQYKDFYRILEKKELPATPSDHTPPVDTSHTEIHH